MSEFDNPLQWKVGDTFPAHRVQFTERDPDIDPTPANPLPRRGINLTAATSITLVAATKSRKRIVLVPCVADPDQASSVDPTEGRGWVTVEPTAELTELAAQMEGEFLVVWAGGGEQRIPNRGWVDVIIAEAFS